MAKEWSSRRSRLAENQSSQMAAGQGDISWQIGRVRSELVVPQTTIKCSFKAENPCWSCGQWHKLNINCRTTVLKLLECFPSSLEIWNKNLFLDFFIPNCLICPPTIPNWWGSLPCFNELASLLHWMSALHCNLLLSIFYLIAAHCIASHCTVI